MSLQTDRDESYKAAQSIVEGARAAGHPMSTEDSTRVQELIDRIKNLDVEIKKAKADEAMLESLGSLSPQQQGLVVPASEEVQRYAANSLGEHFVQSKAYAQLKEYTGERFTVSAPEFELKAPSTFVTGMPASGGLVQTQYGQVVDWPLQRPTVASLLAQGALSATTLTYYVQTSAPASASGGFATVGEAAQKPQLGFSFTPVTESLHKIAGWYAISDEAITDTPYLRTVIDNQLLVRLALAEEDQILNKTGSGTDINGLLNRAGLSVSASGAASGVGNFVAIMNAATNIQVATFMQPDGLVLNPLDYQKMRLATDANTQYYGGGPFTGAYGQPGLPTNPSIWGWSTVITTAIAPGTALLGNFQTGAQLFRKGGVRVDSTNTDGTDFQLNIVKVRAEERLLLAVYQPNCFCKVTLV